MPSIAPTFHGRWRALRSAVTAAVIVLVATPLTAAPAHAGEYSVYVCKMPNGTPIPLDTARWTPSHHRPFSAAAEDCAGGGPIALFMGSPGAPSHYWQGTAARWVFNAGQELVSANARWAVKTTGGNDFAASPEFLLFPTSWGGGTPLMTCAAFTGCQQGHHDLGDHPANAVDWTFPAGTRDLLFELRCGGDPQGYCVNTGTERAIAVLHRAELRLRDSAIPALVSGSVPTGTVLAQGVQTGTRSFRVPVTDYGSGIYQVAVTLGGREVYRGTPDTKGGLCVDAGARAGDPYEFRSTIPCPSRVDLDPPIDTRLVPDGRQRVVVDVFDASGNRFTLHDAEVLIDNVPAPRFSIKPTIGGAMVAGGLRPGDALTSLDGIWEGDAITFTRQWQRSTDGSVWANVPNGTGARHILGPDDVGKQLRVAVTATNREGATTAISEPTGVVKSGATVQPQSVDPGSEERANDGNGAGGNPSTGQLVVDREQRTVDVRHGAKIVITGRLVDGDSQPIADAIVDVFEQVAVTAAPWKKIGSVETDSQGGYVFRPKTTASRRLRFAYADRRNAGDYRATREVFVSVTAAMSIKAKRKVLQRRGLIRLKGRVGVDHLPQTGTWVEIQVLDAGVWRTVATRRTSRTGLWQFRHRLRQSSGVSFRFRARLRPAGDIPAAESRSAPVKVRVR